MKNICFLIMMAKYCIHDINKQIQKKRNMFSVTLQSYKLIFKYLSDELLESLKLHVFKESS